MNKNIITIKEDSSIELYESIKHYHDEQPIGVARRNRMSFPVSAITMLTNDKGNYLIHLNNGYVIADGGSHEIELEFICDEITNHEGKEIIVKGILQDFVC